MQFKTTAAFTTLHNVHQHPSRPRNATHAEVTQRRADQRFLDAPFALPFALDLGAGFSSLTSAAFALGAAFLALAFLPAGAASASSAASSLDSSLALPLRADALALGEAAGAASSAARRNTM